MPIHNWTRVKPGIFHDFQHAWIEELKRCLNDGVLPDDYYAMAEQQTGEFGPDVLTLQSRDGDPAQVGPAVHGNGSVATLTRPKARFTAVSDVEFFRRKKSSIVVRHVSDDHVVAMVEIISPGNKASRATFQDLLEKVRALLANKIHLLLIDLLPPTKRDPHGLHAAIWNEFVEDEPFVPPAEKPLTLAAYESAAEIRAFVEPVAVGDVLPSMPLILKPDNAVEVPLEGTYQRAFAAVPKRWRRILEPA